MKDLSFGAGLPVKGAIADLVAASQEAEALGYDFVWATDDRLQKDVFGVLAAIAYATSTIRLGPGVTNPYSRHPALIATAIATLDELSAGRAVLGLGAGGTNHRALGIERTTPTAAMSEAIGLIRALLAGEEVTLEGRVVHAREAQLDFVPLRAHVPIYVGARGPRMLELAGEKADGVIIGNLASPEGWAYAVDHVVAGATLAGRDPESLNLTAWFYCAINDDAGRALDAVRPMVATSLATSRPILAEIGIELPANYAARMDALGWSLEHHAVMQAGKEIPEDVLRSLSLAGTPADCVRSLRELLAAFPAISQVSIVPATPAGPETATLLRRFMTDVVPALADPPIERSP